MNETNGRMIVCWMKTPMNEINKVAIDHLVSENLILKDGDEYKWHQDAIDLYGKYDEWLHNGR